MGLEVNMIYILNFLESVIEDSFVVLFSEMVNIKVYYFYVLFVLFWLL